LMKFLENPEKDWIIDKAEIEQLSFFWHLVLKNDRI
jgi:hypothetical protein